MTPAETPKSLAAMRDHYRPLLVFAPHEEHGKLRDQVEALKASRLALVERQIVIVPFEGGASSLLGAPIEISLGSEESALRNRFHIPPDHFTVILLGKDGGEKFRSNHPVSIDELTRIIDAMPMRRAEMATRAAENRPR